VTVRERVARTQRVLVAGVLVSAFAWGAGVYLASLAIVAGVASLIQNPGLAGTFALPISLILGLGAMLVVLWRGRRVVSTSRVALWIEERLPRLHYALITAIEPGLDADAPALESAVGRRTSRESLQSRFAGRFFQRLERSWQESHYYMYCRLPLWAGHPSLAAWVEMPALEVFQPAAG